MGYILGKSEGEGVKWHGHVTAVTVAPEYRFARKSLTQCLHTFCSAAVVAYPQRHQQNALLQASGFSSAFRTASICLACVNCFAGGSDWRKS